MVIHRVDYDDQLTTQFEFMMRSAAAFDEGVMAEAQRLATTARVLLNDSGRAKSLLSQMSLLDTMTFLDTADQFRPASSIVSTLLLDTMVGGPSVFVARLGDRFVQRCRCGRADCVGRRRGPERERWLAFSDWKQRVALAIPGGATLTVWDIVLIQG